MKNYKITERKEGALAAKGFLAASIYAGIRKVEKDDLMLLVSEVPAEAALVSTASQVTAWCVQHNKERIRQQKASAVLCSAGNANCCNGIDGKKADDLMASVLASELQKKGYAGAPVMTASTGVIGRPLPVEKITDKLPLLVSELAADYQRAAEAIMTTDLVAKSYALEVETPQGKFHVGGMAKGSGMIAPNMATMLAFITTDLKISGSDLQLQLKKAVDKSFNCISVDADTSTNDMTFILANGLSGISLEANEQAFTEALTTVCTELAKMIARDGEGATKLINLKIRGADSEQEAFRVAKTIAESPLVKTACFGNDPNWGRILAAAGRSGVSFDVNKVSVSLAGIEIFRAGAPAEYNPDEVSSKMKSKDLEIVFKFIDQGSSDIDFWTCDFSYDYVRINADYGT